jgi:hypothetical protein
MSVHILGVRNRQVGKGVILYEFRAMGCNCHAVDGYSDASGSDNSELVVPRTALATMEMNGLERLVIWNNLYIRITLKSIQGKNRSMKGKKDHTQRAPAKSISRTTF